MEFKVKAVDANVEEKSRAQVEEALLKEHAEQFENQQDNSQQAEKVDLSQNENSTTEETSVDETKIEEASAPEFGDDDVLSYIKKRYNKDINSIDDLFEEKKSNEELPEDVSAYLKYKQETGRGINDFYKLQKDIDAMDDNAVLANYYESTEDGLDSDDIQDIINDKFSYD